jgi:hypothetical protein
MFALHNAHPRNELAWRLGAIDLSFGFYSPALTLIWNRFQCQQAGMNVLGRGNTRYNMQIGFYVQRAAFEESLAMLSRSQLGGGT